MNDNEPAVPPGGGGLESSLRVRLDFGYDGSAFSGWAAQPGLRTVEDELSSALSMILRASRPVRLTVPACNANLVTGCRIAALFAVLRSATLADSTR